MNSILNGRMVSYQNDLQRSYMVFKLLEEDIITEYQIKMIQGNPTEGLLLLHKKQIDNDIYFFYDITSKTTLNQLLKRIKVNKHKFLSILKSLIRSISLGKQYLLQGGSFILSGDHIYIDPISLELSIAYLPIESKSDINQEVKALIMDLLIYKASFETPAEGDFVYELLSLIKIDSFNTNQLDKIISRIALQQEQRIMLDSTEKHDLVQKVRVPREDNIKTKQKLNNLLLVLTQLFILAIAVLLARYFYYQTEKLDVSTLIGIATIIIAADTLIVRRFTLKSKSSSTEQKSNKKKLKLNLSLIHKRLKGNKKIKRYTGVQSTPQEECAAAHEPRDFKDFETCFMVAETPKLACLIGCGENDQEKIFIDKPSFVIGRIKSQSDYVSFNGAVGKLHAEITNKDGAYYMKDLNSRNGTFINGERIVSNVEHSLQNNDRIAFANSEYKFLWN